jgi:hypothetical protein
VFCRAQVEILNAGPRNGSGRVELHLDFDGGPGRAMTRSVSQPHRGQAKVTLTWLSSGLIRQAE